MTSISHPSSLTTFPFSAVSYATFYWRNKEDNIQLPKQPKYLTANDIIFDATAIAPYGQGYECETMLERAKRLDILDEWTAVFKLTMKNGHPLVFEGERAIKLHEAWKGFVFSASSKGKKRKK